MEIKEKKIGLFCPENKLFILDDFIDDYPIQASMSDDKVDIESLVLDSDIIWIYASDINLSTLSTILNVPRRLYNKQVIIEFDYISDDFISILDNVSMDMVTNMIFKSSLFHEKLLDRYSKLRDSNILFSQCRNVLGEVLEIPQAFSESKPITISACMIVRDEEKYLNDCLDSLDELVDEIIIVDTGSTDGTIDIAKKYTGRIYSHEWKDDFSYHRNQSIEYASSDWILIIDADEQFKGDAKELKKVLGSIVKGFNGVAISVRDACKGSGVVFNSTRLFRKGSIQYKRAIHNVPVCENIDKFGAILFQGAEIVHYGSHYQITESEKVKKTLRTRTLLHRSLEADPKDYELHFYLMQLYGSLNDYKKAIQHGNEYLNHRNEIILFNNSVYYSLIQIYVEMGKVKEAKDLLRTAKIILPLDMDICYCALEIGILSRNRELVQDNGREYVKLYELYDKYPDMQGSRFVYTHKPDCLYYVLFHLTNSLFQESIPCLKNLKSSISLLQKEDQGKAIKEIQKMLKNQNVETN